MDPVIRGRMELGIRAGWVEKVNGGGVGHEAGCAICDPSLHI